MEYIEGATLATLLAERRLELREALGYAGQIAGALARAHAEGIIHRDLKPANVMVTPVGRVKLLDFGLAKLIEEVGPDDETATQSRAFRTEEGAILGTVAYMSPEQAAGKRVDVRSDVFSFGAVLYEMLAGRRAFAGETRLATLSAVLTQEPTPLRGLVPELPRELERVVQLCLRKDPQQRLQNIADVELLLESARTDTEALPRVTPPGAEQRQRWMVAGFVAGVLLAAAASAVIWLWLQPAPTGRAPALTLRRMTFDPGLSVTPALSPDGKFLAYASDRSGEGNLDIWVRQTGGGQPIPLTRDPADDHSPDFSPDGTRIVFRSQRQGGGIYIVSTLGGDDRLLAQPGWQPRFSPDGKSVVYAVGSGLSSTLWIAPADGGSPRQVETGLAFSRWPSWSPDGRRIVFVGASQGSNFADKEFWSVPPEGGRAVPMGVSAALRERKIGWDHWAQVYCWIGTDLLIAGLSGNSWNLWRLALDPVSGAALGVPERFTFGVGESGPAASTNGRIAFSSELAISDLWSAELDAGTMRRRTSGPSRRATASGWCSSPTAPGTSTSGRETSKPERNPL